MRAVALPPVRIVRGAIGAQLSHQFVDADGDAADPTGTVTVAVTRADATTVTGLSVTGSGTDPRTVTLSTADTATIDWLTAVWSIDGTEVATDVTEIVGGVLINETAAKAIDPSLANHPRFKAARKATEDTVTTELCRSPFQRFYTERVDGTGTCALRVSWPDISEVVWARVWSNTTSTDLTAGEVAALVPDDRQRSIARTDGNVWPYGHRNIEIGYRFGFNFPNDLHDNLVVAIRWHLNKFSNGLPFLGESVVLPEGGVIRSNRPGVGVSITGNDDVDATIRRYAFKPALVA
jgi:hypothetical protein